MRAAVFNSSRQPSAHFLQLEDVPRPELRPGYVLLRVVACGVCRTDLHIVEGDLPQLQPRLIPGHQIVGEILDGATEDLLLGTRVGVSWMGGVDGDCRYCRHGEENLCDNPVFTGYSVNGGYAEYALARTDFVYPLPAGLDDVHVAPLLCAGITTYSPLKHWNVGPGMKVGVVGLGGLGHMGLKFSHAFGAKTVQFTTSAAKVEDAQRLGADEVILTKEPNWAAQHAHSFDFILDCVSANHDVDTYLRLLKRNGVMCSVGIPEIPVSIHAFSVLGRKAFTGSMVGGIRETQAMLDFCAENGIASDIEMTSFSNLVRAWERVVKADVKYRFVLDLKTL